MKTKTGCPKKLYSWNGQISYCLTPEPIITDADFENVGAIQYDSANKMKYLILRLTDSGYQMLRVLNQKLPGTRLALVVTDTVAGVFDNPNKILSPNVPVRGAINAGEVEWINRKLKQSTRHD